MSEPAMSDVEVVRRGLMMRDAGYGEPKHLWEQVGALLKEYDKARALVAALCDVATYSDSYGVPGSEFACCRFCNAGAPGVEFKHDATCPVGKADELTEQWYADFHALEAENGKLRKALKPFAHYYHLNDCHERDPDDALQVPISDLRDACTALADPEHMP